MPQTWTDAGTLAPESHEWGESSLRAVNRREHWDKRQPSVIIGTSLALLPSVRVPSESRLGRGFLGVSFTEWSCAYEYLGFRVLPTKRGHFPI